jgi:hypothetical protein
VNFWKARFRTIHLSLIAARDENRVTKCRELSGEFVTDACPPQIFELSVFPSVLVDQLGARLHCSKRIFVMQATEDRLHKDERIRRQAMTGF